MNKADKSMLVLFAAVILMAGCQKEEQESIDNETIKVHIEDSDTRTRTSFDSVEGKYSWTEGDKIAICYSDGTYTEAPVNVTKSTVLASSTVSRTRANYAIYPASAKDAANYGAPTLKVNLPSSYDIRDIISGSSTTKTADFSPLPMVAKNTSGVRNLNFHHVGGLLRITLTKIKPETKTVTVTFDKDVTGTYTINVADEMAPTITTAGTASNNVVTFILAPSTNTSSAVGTLTSPVVLNVPVPCGTYNEITVATKDSVGTELASAIFESPLKFERHHGKKLSVKE